MPAEGSESKQSAVIKAARAEIAKCVSCGFCNAACPTYSLDQYELDGPRGRISLVKELINGRGEPKIASQHLSRCLTCRSCETACPSGVGYSKIAHAGRELAGQELDPRIRFKQLALGELIRSRSACRAGRIAAKYAGSLLPSALRAALAPSPLTNLALPKARHRRQVAVLAGCAQTGLMPATNVALAQLLDAAGFKTNFITTPCCGAIRTHSGRAKAGLADVRRTLEACRDRLVAGDHAILVAASGCASFITEYPMLLADEPSKARKARKVASSIVDPAVFLRDHLAALQKHVRLSDSSPKVAVHAPCTLVNGMRSGTVFADLLRQIGFDIITPRNTPNCCGSAGTYSLFQPRRAKALRQQLCDAIGSTAATQAASANIGCVLHMRQAIDLPIHHWLEICAQNLEL